MFQLPYHAVRNVFIGPYTEETEETEETWKRDYGLNVDCLVRLKVGILTGRSQLQASLP